MFLNKSMEFTNALPLRSFLMLKKDISNRIDKLEQETNKMIKIIFERLDDIDEKINLKLAENRRKIGLKN